MRHHSRFPAQTRVGVPSRRHRVGSQDRDIGRGPNGREEIGACLHRGSWTPIPSIYFVRDGHPHHLGCDGGGFLIPVRPRFSSWGSIRRSPSDQSASFLDDDNKAHCDPPNRQSPIAPSPFAELGGKGSNRPTPETWPRMVATMSWGRWRDGEGRGSVGEGRRRWQVLLLLQADHRRGLLR